MVAQPQPVRKPLPLYLGDEPLLGHRIWRVERHADSFRLGSIAKPTTWQPREEFHAGCWRDISFINCGISNAHALDDHRAPWPDGNCQCGIWAFRDDYWPTHALWAYGAQLFPSTVAWAIGSVHLWGRVVEHPRGWRAEFAYPVGLQLLDPVRVWRNAAELPALLQQFDAGGSPAFELERVARELAADYLIPVTVAAQLPPPPDPVALAAAKPLIIYGTGWATARERRRRDRVASRFWLALCAVSLLIAATRHGFWTVESLTVAFLALVHAIELRRRARSDS